jgi:hypothetical protein
MEAIEQQLTVAEAGHESQEIRNLSAEDPKGETAVDLCDQAIALVDEQLHTNILAAQQDGQRPNRMDVYSLSFTGYIVGGLVRRELPPAKNNEIYKHITEILRKLHKQEQLELSVSVTEWIFGQASEA